MLKWLNDYRFWILMGIIALIIWFIVKPKVIKAPQTPQAPPIDYSDPDAALAHLEQDHIRKENAQLLQDLAEANQRKWTDEGLVQIHLQCGRRSCNFVIQLLFKEAPCASLNFMALAGLHPTIRPTYSYIGTPIHRWIKDMCIQMGDVLHKGGRTIYSIYDTPFKHEGSKQLDQEGLVAMISDGPDRNGCQFMVMTHPAPWLNGQYTVFGVIVDGFTRLLKFGDTIEVNQDGTPTLPIHIQRINIYQEI